MNRTDLAFLLLLLSSVALAQAPNPYDGSWTVSFENRKGASMRGTLVVQGAGGTWQVQVPPARQALRAQGLAACEGLQAPVKVNVATSKRLVIMINRSQARAGCRNAKMAFDRVDERTLKGAFPDGRALSLVRE